MRALNIEVPPDLADAWAGWFAPRRQPFLTDRRLADSLSLRWERSELRRELRDTFAVYELPEHLGLVWLEEGRLAALPRAARRALVRAQLAHGRAQVPSVRAWVSRLGSRVREQADGHRFVWWPTLLAPVAEEVLVPYVEGGRRPSRHDEVPERVWQQAASLLPAARRLAGTFRWGSGPNCFGTVMAAAGVPGAEDQWLHREPFSDWLRRSARHGGVDSHPGTVLVWRSRDGRVQHAAVTLGEGWALHKPSQGWYDPVKVLTVGEVKGTARSAGRRLERHTLDR